MKITGIGRVGSIQQYNRQQEMKSWNGDRKDKLQRDGLTISNEAKEMLEARGRGESSATDRVKLQELKQSVSDGTYRVDARQIADKLFPFLR